MKCPHCNKDISEKEIQAHMGRVLGESNKGKTSDKKKRASRINGKLGGRPKNKPTGKETAL
tara:strand:- start:25 stop:207 length:183 start_codon:yes stop_codon:yes gene_type:complete